MTRLKYDKASRISQIHANGSERNILLPGGEGETVSAIDPDYKPTETIFKKIAKRVNKKQSKKPVLKFNERIKPFFVETKKKKILRKLIDKSKL